MARKLTVKLWDILSEQEKTTLEYFNSINDQASSAIKSVVDEVNQINVDVENKVDKVSGKGLSTNDYTTVEKQKLQGVDENANNYVHPNDANTRHVTDIEKTTWNGKANVGDIPNIVAGTNVTIDKNGNTVTINSTASGGGDYTLPTASATVKGGVKVGSGLTMNGDVLSATGGGSADLTKVTTSIIPTTNRTLDLGSPTNRFKNLYVDEAHLATNTLYIGDVPVLGTEQGNILVKADANQNLGVKTTGMGNVGIHSSNIAEMLSDGVGGTVNVKAMGTNGTVNITSATGRIEMTAPTINMSGNTTTGNLTIGGNLTVQGTTTTVDSANLSVADNIIEINKGETGQGVSKVQAGIKVKRGDLQDQHIVFDESDDKWKIGEGTTLKNVATEDIIPTKTSQLQNDSNYATTSQIPDISSKADTTYVNTELGKKIDKTQIKNTLTETVEGGVLDATQGKILDDKFSNLSTQAMKGSENKSTVNLNTLIKTDIYQYPDFSDPSRVGAPDNYGGTVIHEQLSPTYANQIANALNKKMYKRTQINEVWSEWEELATTLKTDTLQREISALEARIVALGVDMMMEKEMLPIEPVEPQNPFTDAFKAKWYDRYTNEPKLCTLEDLQILYTHGKLTKEDFVIITGQEPTNEPKPLDKTEILEQEVSRLEIEMLKMKKGMI